MARALASTLAVNSTLAEATGVIKTQNRSVRIAKTESNEKPSARPSQSHCNVVASAQHRRQALRGYPGSLIGVSPGFQTPVATLRRREFYNPTERCESTQVFCE